MKIDSDLKRIIENENIRCKLEALNTSLNNELDSCKDFHLSRLDCRKYGVTIESLLSVVLSKFIEVKKK